MGRVEYVFYIIVVTFGKLLELRSTLRLNLCQGFEVLKHWSRAIGAMVVVQPRIAQ
jgi:hypothetical protein